MKGRKTAVRMEIIFILPVSSEGSHFVKALTDIIVYDANIHPLSSLNEDVPAGFTKLLMPDAITKSTFLPFAFQANIKDFIISNS